MSVLGFYGAGGGDAVLSFICVTGPSPNLIFERSLMMTPQFCLHGLMKTLGAWITAIHAINFVNMTVAI